VNAARIDRRKQGFGSRHGPLSGRKPRTLGHDAQHRVSQALVRLRQAVEAAVTQVREGTIEIAETAVYLSKAAKIVNGGMRR
jgi:hypothetical protein